MNENTSDQQRPRDLGADSTLGEHLRHAREQRGITLRELSDQTRISRRHLEAIEQDDYKQLPGGIFNRSFIKSFARAVGFSEDEALTLYAATTRARGDAPEEDAPLRQPSRIYTDGASSRSPLVTALLSLLILTIISLGVYAGLHYYRRDAEGISNNVPTTTGATTATGGAALPAGAAATPTNALPAPTPAAGLNVRVRAKGEDVWLRTRVDAEPNTDGILKAEQVKDFAPSARLSLQYSKSKAAALEVTVNGRPATVPTDAPGKPLVEMLITEDAPPARLPQQP